MKIPYFKQGVDWTCGAASMRMVLASFGIRKSEKEIVGMLGTNKTRGTKNKAFSALAEKLKLSYAVKRNSSLVDLKFFLGRGYKIIICYFILEEKTGHYAVVSKISRDKIHLLDPIYGEEHTLSLKEFVKIWKNNPKYDNEKGWFIGIKK